MSGMTATGTFPQVTCLHPINGTTAIATFRRVTCLHPINGTTAAATFRRVTCLHLVGAVPSPIEPAYPHRKLAWEVAPALCPCALGLPWRPPPS
jgi:hypothetical protein